jgi:hypothetical protein
MLNKQQNTLDFNYEFFEAMERWPAGSSPAGIH